MWTNQGYMDPWALFLRPDAVSVSSSRHVCVCVCMGGGLMRAYRGLESNLALGKRGQ